MVKDYKISTPFFEFGPKAYLYGEGETVKATPEEVAYMTMREQNDSNFL